MMQRPLGPILTAAEMRDAELAAATNGISLATLMERAGKAVADTVIRFYGGREVLILCGPGNNGGDGYVAARLLRDAGVSVRVAAFGEPRTELAQNARARWTGSVEDARASAPAPLLVDALFGTGLTRPIDGEIASHFWDLAQDAQWIIAVDLPSGIQTDTGAVLGAAKAQVTVALGALKPAHLLHPGAAMCGSVIRADLGMFAWSDAHVLRRPELRAPAPDSHKYKRGYAVVAGGAMGGAAMLAAKAAMRLAGYVALTGARRTGPEALVHRRWADVAEDARIGALLIGPGLGRSDGAREQLAAALATPHQLVLDADALRLIDPAMLDQLRVSAREMIMTPHDGEFQALFGALPGSKIERARAAAAQSGAVIILKGADTVIASPRGKVAVASGLPGWLASAGTGDVLAGLCVAALAGSDGVLSDAFEAACTAVWLHGEAARRAGPALIADDLPRHISDAVRICL